MNGPSQLGAPPCRLPPGPVLGRMDLASQSLYPKAIVTCFYGLMKGGGTEPRILHHSAAGHLPPLLTTREGETRYLEDGAGLLLGVQPETPRTTATDEIPPYATLLLFADGLIERRGESIDDSMARLRQHAATWRRRRKCSATS